MLFALIALHAVCGTVVLLAGRRLGRAAWVVGGLAPASVVAWLGANLTDVSGGEAVTGRAGWVEGLGLALDVRVDGFSALMILLVSGIGVLVFAYAWHYFGRSEKGPRVAGLLTLFAGSMLGVVVADNLLALYVFWELTSITSYLLIGTDHEDPAARDAARQALMVTALGGLAMLGGMVAIGQQAGTFTLSEVLASPPSGTITSVALVFVLVGAFTKSAQYPFHSWLPGAMVAATPISAYLHSAAMVKAGVYLVARLAPAFAEVGPWRPLVVTVGLVTMVAGGLRALHPNDLKQLLAFGTISQLGFMVVLFGIGHPAATAAACALILAHGLFKAALFMVVGIVDHEAGTRDIRELPVLGAGWTPTKVVALASAASMAAVAPLAGFVAKEQAYTALFEGTPGDQLVLVGIVVGSILTVAYSLRLVAALVRPDLLAARPGRAASDHAPTTGFLAPALLLAACSVVLGVVPAVWSGLVDDAANALDPRSHSHLALWHGVTVPLLLSLGTLAVGVALFWGRDAWARVARRLTIPLSGQRVVEVLLRGTSTGATKVASVVQSGSLPIYAAIILATAVVAPMGALLAGSWWPGWPELLGASEHVPIAAVLLGGALAATLATRRFAAAILLGVVGYGMALFFAVQGAPDLALTQFSVETLSVVVFLLVLRVLPDRFVRRAPAFGRTARLAVSIGVGVFVVVMGIASYGARTQPSVSAEMSEVALPEGHGRNVVNVILVDIRGLDTMGEITVLATAGIGIVALAKVGRRRRSSDSVEPAEEVAAG